MQRPIRALLLSAGLGTRLRPLTLNIPKCLVEINKKPLIESWLNKLEEINVEKTLINTHYLHDQVKTFLESFNSKKIKIKLEHEIELLGTAGTLIKNHDFFSNKTGMMIHSDNFTNMKLFDLLDAHYKRPKNCLITMLTFNTNDPRSCGILEIDNNGIVQKFYEKVENPPGNIANGAIYIFENEFLEWLLQNNPKAKDFSNEVLPLLLGKIYTHHTNMKYIDIGNPQSLKEARSLFK